MSEAIETGIEQALRTGTVPWIVVDIVSTAVTDRLEEHGYDEGEGVPPEWVR